MKWVYNYTKDTSQKEEKYNPKKKYSLARLPSKKNITVHYPAVYDQGDIGSCTGNSISIVLKYMMNRAKSHNNFKTIPSRLFIYNNGRLHDKLPINNDSGCSIKGALKGLDEWFAVDETIYPYNKTNAFKKPDKHIYDMAKKYKQFEFERVEQNLYDIKHSIAMGIPVILGIEVYESLESKKTLYSGVISIPDTKKENYLGGHCVNLCGFDDDTELFLLCNSWGSTVGLPYKLGYFKIPYAYILDKELTNDLWRITVFR
jgi:C1A family cysteine protease